MFVLDKRQKRCQRPFLQIARPMSHNRLILVGNRSKPKGIQYTRHREPKLILLLIDVSNTSVTTVSLYFVGIGSSLWLLPLLSHNFTVYVSLIRKIRDFNFLLDSYKNDLLTIFKIVAISKKKYLVIQNFIFSFSINSNRKINKLRCLRFNRVS